jgi:voltage-gated potassium channel
MKFFRSLLNNRFYYRSFISLISISSYACCLLLLVAVERSSNSASIHSFWDAMWYSVVTLTTVGYGDMSPVTPYGRVIGYIFVFGSLGVIGFLLGNLFSLLADIKENKRLGRNGTQFVNHIVIVGWNKFTHSVLEQLVNTNVRVVVITRSKADIDTIKEHFDSKQIFVLYSEFEKLEYIRDKANLNKAFCLFINMGNDTDNLVHLINYKQEFGNNLKFPVAVDNQELVETFEHTGADEIVFKDELAAKLIASYIFEPDVAEYAEDLLSSSQQDGNFDVQEYKVTAENVFLNRAYEEAFFEVRDNYGSILIGIVKEAGGAEIVLKNPSDPSVKIELGDFLIIITDGIAEKKLIADFHVQEGSITVQ